MTVKERMIHIRTYYKLQLIGGAAAVILVIYFLVLFTRQDPDYRLNAAFVNEYENVTEGSDVMDGFLNTEAGSSLKADQLNFDAAYFFDLSDGQDFTNTYFQKLVAKIENGDIDVMIMSRENLLGIAQGGRTLDLQNEKAAALAENYRDRLIFYTDDETGEEIPVGIDLSGSSVITGYEESDQVCIGLSSKIQHEEEAKAFIDYLLQ